MSAAHAETDRHVQTGIGLLRWMLREDEENLGELAQRDHVSAVAGSLMLSSLLLHTLAEALDETPEDLLDMIQAQMIQDASA